MEPDRIVSVQYIAGGTSRLKRVLASNRDVVRRDLRESCTPAPRSLEQAMAAAWTLQTEEEHRGTPRQSVTVATEGAATSESVPALPSQATVTAGGER